jgi:putative transposase
MVSPQAKRQGVCYLVEERDYSERKACQVVGISRSSARYQRRLRPDEATLRSKIRETAEQHPTYGCPRITVLIRREGSNINHKRIHRLWKEEGLQLPRRRPRKRHLGPKGEVKQKAEYPNHVWSYDFLEDRTEKGSKLRFLTVLDEFTREALALPVQRSFTAKDVIATLEWIALQRGLPIHIRSDNGPEFVAQAVTTWIEQHHSSTIFITPGSPWENPYIESFNGKFRQECLDRYLFINVQEAQLIAEDWRHEYNCFRPHSSLDYLSPREFASRHALLGAIPSAHSIQLPVTTLSL